MRRAEWAKWEGKELVVCQDGKGIRGIQDLEDLKVRILSNCQPESSWQVLILKINNLADLTVNYKIIMILNDKNTGKFNRK